jgi:hypothetical protein
VISVLNAAGARAISKNYRPYGQVSQWVTDPAAAAEDQGFVGQRHDWHAGVIYLNARSMDPERGRVRGPRQVLGGDAQGPQRCTAAQWLHCEKWRPA